MKSPGVCTDDLMLSIIVPTFDEQDSLRELYQQTVHVLDAIDLQAELIFVDDGSTDGSWLVIEELAQADPRLVGIRFRRNFGKAAALTAGLRTARGDLVMTMDADLQDDPAEIPAFLEKLQEGYDVANGWKVRRLDPWHKVYPSKVFNALVSWLTGLRLHDHNCGLKMFRREVADELSLYGEMHRFVPVLAHARGFLVTEVPVHHRPRVHGYSKYGVKRFLRGFLDVLTIKFLIGFGQRPQHMLGALGLVFFGLGMLGLIYLSGLWFCMNVLALCEPQPIGTRPLLAYSMAAALLGFQAISLGLLAELIVANTVRAADTYSIAERAGTPCDTPDAVREVGGPRSQIGGRKVDGRSGTVGLGDHDN